MKNEYKKLYTYCAWGKDGNIMGEIESKNINAWKTNYISGFNEGYTTSLDKPVNVQKVYCDPDKTYKNKKGYKHQFFEQLELFLKNREKDLEKELNGAYDYKFVEGKGIEVSGSDKNGVEIESFYLRSDQLGFSAPSNEKAYPYDLYIIKNKYSDEAVKQVADWIIASRTIGGSFLWPIPFYDQYNRQRGGKITSNRQYYIQDRVDLTLREIYFWYKDENKSTIMTRCDKENSNLRIWLTHFKDFQTYIKFFCFEDFVNDGYPIDIIRGEKCEPEWERNGQKPKVEITEELCIKKIESMLKRLNSSILNRSAKMVKKIEAEKK